MLSLPKALAEAIGADCTSPPIFGSPIRALNDSCYRELRYG